MNKPDSLLIQAVREAGESFNDLLQVIALEAYCLANLCSLDKEAAARVSRIAQATRAAVDLCCLLHGETGKFKRRGEPEGRSGTESLERPDRS